MGARQKYRVLNILVAVGVLGFCLPHVVQAQIIQGPNGHWYQAVEARPALTWAGAETRARNMYYQGLPGHLVTITSASEQQFIVSRFPSAVTQNFWIGGYQPPGSEEPHGGWQWVTGEPWSYTAWNNDEPNNANNSGAPPGEDRLILWSTGLWNDYSGALTIGGFVVEYEPPAPTFLDVRSSNLTGSQPTIVTVNLNSNAPVGGAEVRLNSNNAALIVPRTITIPLGTRSRSFTITTRAVTTKTIVTVTASYNNTTKQVAVTLNPVSVAALHLTPGEVIGGSATSGMIVLDATPSTDVVANLTSNMPGVVFVPARISIPAGVGYKVFNITTTRVTNLKSVTISATLNTGIRREVLLVYPE